MAVSNDDDDGVSPSLTDNPFSFKKFVSGRSVTEDQKVKKKKPVTKKKDAGSSDGVLFPEVVGGGGREGPNPFSFKTFMKKQKNESHACKGPDSEHLQLNTDSSFSSDDDSVEETSVETHLPLLSDITHDPTQDQTQPPQKPSSEQPNRDLFADSSESSDNDNQFHFEKEKTTDRLVVEDKSAIGGSDPMEPFPGVINLIPGDDQSRIRAEIIKVKDENEQLRKQLKQCEENLKKEKKKSKSLMKEMKSLREKEQKETKALEEMVLKVEENLATANTRSLTAEATIAKLRKEIHKLQSELVKSTPQAVHKSYEDLILGVREKANYASQQLSATAHKADLQIKELCQGIEALKRVSEILMNVDSSFEVTT